MQRVVEEKAALDEKIGKLVAFHASDKFDTLSPTAQAHLVAQLGVMRDYSRILRLRIEDASKPEADFLAGAKACDLSGEGTCEACQ